jgi:drug/metabolite transporter (DMT)-like permease
MLIGATLVWHLPSIALVLWGAGRLGPARVSILLMVELIAAAGSAALWAGEPFGWREAAGCVLILTAGALEAAGHRRTRPG